MSHFAKVFDDKVIKVIVAESDFFQHFVDPHPGTWIRTSYNTRGNVHYGADGNPDGGQAIRANFAGVGYTYDKINDVFYAPQPYPSWSLNRSTWLWEPPVPYPSIEKPYMWDEDTLSWIEISIPENNLSN